MMKKLTLLLALLCAFATANAYDFMVDGLCYQINGPNVSVVQSDDYATTLNGAVDVPSMVTYNGASYTVTQIGNYAFRGCTGITSLNIPATVTYIGIRTLDYCDNLTSLTVDSNNPKYDSRNNCNAICITSMNSLYRACNATVLPTNLKQIDTYAFSGCTGITSIDIPEGVIAIYMNAFQYCENLASIHLPSSLRTIDSGAFQFCKSLTSITIPASVVSISYNGQVNGQSSPFYNCENLKTIVVEEGNEYYDSRDNCNAIVKTDINTLIYACEGTTIPSSVIVGKNAFRGCAITDIVVPEGVTTIEQQAFNYCASLTTVSLPTTLTTIGDCAFQGCSSLESIVVADGNTTFDSRDNCNAIIKTSDNELIVGCSTTIIPASVITIADNAFRASSITDVAIPEDVTTIESFAFYECGLLKTVILPSTLTKIGYGAFQVCNSLTDIYAYPESNSVTLADDIWAFMDVDLWSSKDCNLHVYSKDYDYYSTADQWKEFNVIGDLDATNVYILGDIDQNSWDPTTGKIMNLNNNGLYTAEITCDGRNEGYNYFGFTSELAENNDEGGWAYIEPFRFGAVSEGDFDVTDEMLGRELSLTYDNYHAFKIPEGEYNLNLNLETMKLVITKKGLLLGDVDLSGKVDVTDINILVNIILGKDNAANYDGRADLDNSGKVDVSDVNAVVNIILGKN